MNIISFGEINSRLISGAEDFIRQSENEFDELCRDAAGKIAASEKPLILLSGPSGSGKTTTALKIEAFLDDMGLETHTISMDNYFLPKDRINTYDENGEIDYESPYRIDIDLLQEHMSELADCREVEIPLFDFTMQDRCGTKKLKRGRGELILFEGIHALNPEVTGYEDISSRLYVSVRTRIQMSDGELFHPEFIRLMRRIIRDNNYRGRSISDTMRVFGSVQRGERLYIEPYKNRAHYHLDTFMPYEAAAYKTFIGDEISLVQPECADEKYLNLKKLFSDLEACDEKYIPERSLIREFIGGSGFSY